MTLHKCDSALLEYSINAIAKSGLALWLRISISFWSRNSRSFQ